jgi:hypothetical protein
LGRSAYTGAHRQNPDRHALAAFLKLVEAGRVPHGSYLLIENLDRLSREDEVPACHLLTGILMAGVRVVQLSPYEMLLTEKSNGWELMRAVMELSRGHNESAMKSERVGKAWAEKKKAARAGEWQPPRKRDGRVTKALTGRLPAWVEERGGKLCLIPSRAALVKRIFQMAAGGYGNALIVKRLTAEKVPAFGGCEEDAEGHRRARAGQPFGSGHWTRTYVAIILKDRRALGEFQPRKRDGSPDGEPIRDYLPSVVTEQEWLAARAGAAQRRKVTGDRRWTEEEDELVRTLSVKEAARRTKRTRAAVRLRRVKLRLAVKRGKLERPHVNVFAGLLRNARDGDTYYCATRTDGGKHVRVLINTNAAEGRASCWSFPYDTFERAVLALLREVTPDDAQPAAGAEPDERDVLQAQLDNVRARLGEVNERLEAGEAVATLTPYADRLEREEQELKGKLEEAQQLAAYPADAAWKEFKTLAEMLDNAPEPQDARVRLRAAMRRIVEGIWLLVVPRGRDRLAAVQIWFDAGHCRTYLVLHRPPKSNGRSTQDGRWAAVSWAVGRETDLRDAEELPLVEQVLQGGSALLMLDGGYGGDCPEMPLVGGVIPAHQS